MTETQTQTGWSEDRIIAIVRDMAAAEDLPSHLATAPIKPQDTVESLGMDSLGAVYLVERLEEEAGVPLPDDFLDFHDDVSAIAMRMAELVKSGG